jgi:hypothetical protein
VAARLQRPRAVPADVVEEDRPAGAHGVVRELLRLDELLDAHLGDVAQPGQHLGELGVGVDPVRVGGAGAGDGLDDDGVADPLHCLVHPGDGRGARVAWRPDTGGVQHLLHPLLVPERDGLRHAHPGQAERLADPGREDHVRLPEALDLLDRGMAGQAVQRAEHGTLVGEGDVLVVGERGAGLDRQRVRRLVADADHGGPDGGQRPREVGHLQRVAGADHDDVHSASTSSTRTPATMRRSASATTAVSGSRTVT